MFGNFLKRLVGVGEEEPNAASELIKSLAESDNPEEELNKLGHEGVVALLNGLNGKIKKLVGEICTLEDRARNLESDGDAEVAERLKEEAEILKMELNRLTKNVMALDMANRESGGKLSGMIEAVKERAYRKITRLMNKVFNWGSGGGVIGGLGTIGLIVAEAISSGSGEYGEYIPYTLMLTAMSALAILVASRAEPYSHAEGVVGGANRVLEYAKEREESGSESVRRR